MSAREKEHSGKPRSAHDWNFMKCMLCMRHIQLCFYPYFYLILEVKYPIIIFFCYYCCFFPRLLLKKILLTLFFKKKILIHFEYIWNERKTFNREKTLRKKNSIRMVWICSSSAQCFQWYIYRNWIVEEMKEKLSNIQTDMRDIQLVYIYYIKYIQQPTPTRYEKERWMCHSCHAIALPCVFPSYRSHSLDSHSAGHISNTKIVFMLLLLCSIRSAINDFLSFSTSLKLSQKRALKYYIRTERNKNKTKEETDL